MSLQEMYECALISSAVALCSKFHPHLELDEDSGLPITLRNKHINTHSMKIR